MNVEKRKGVLMVVGIVALALVLANWVVPEALVAIEASGKGTRAYAQALLADYAGEISQKTVCRDLVLLNQQHLTPERICGVRDGKVIYAMQVEGLDHQFDVTRSWSGTMYYHSTDATGGEGTLCVRPWGSTRLY